MRECVLACALAVCCVCVCDVVFCDAAGHPGRVEISEGKVLM